MEHDINDNTNSITTPEYNSSYIISVMSAIRGLHTIERNLNVTKWKGSNEEQETFLQKYYPYWPLPEAENQLSYSWKAPNVLDATSLFSVNLCFKYPAEKATMKCYNHNYYQTVRMDQGFKLFCTADRSRKYICLDIKGDYTLFLSPVEGDVFREIALLAYLESMEIDADCIHPIRKIQFPLMCYKSEATPIASLYNLKACVSKKQTFLINSLEQYNSLHIDETTMMTPYSAGINFLKHEDVETIDQPYYIWIKHPLSKIPFMIGYSGPDSWK